MREATMPITSIPDMSRVVIYGFRWILRNRDYTKGMVEDANNDVAKKKEGDMHQRRQATPTRRSRLHMISLGIIYAGRNPGHSDIYIASPSMVLI
jgi:hypothetical protein